MLIDIKEYNAALHQTIECIKTAQYEAVVNTNLALLHRNWKIGAIIVEKSQWGNKFISNLADDIKSEFPGTTGFSARNLQYMKKFATAFDG